eukprot:6213581-Pleurochrysis_carterae.AAC.2
MRPHAYESEHRGSTLVFNSDQLDRAGAKLLAFAHSGRPCLRCGAMRQALLRREPHQQLLTVTPLLSTMLICNASCLAQHRTRAEMLAQAHA